MLAMLSTGADNCYWPVVEPNTGRKVFDFYT